jgi:hypothetical protein
MQHHHAGITQYVTHNHVYTPIPTHTHTTRTLPVQTTRVSESKRKNRDTRIFSRLGPRWKYPGFIFRAPGRMTFRARPDFLDEEPVAFVYDDFTESGDYDVPCEGTDTDIYGHA